MVACCLFLKWPPPSIVVCDCHLLDSCCPSGQEVLSFCSSVRVPSRSPLTLTLRTPAFPMVESGALFSLLFCGSECLLEAWPGKTVTHWSDTC